MTGVRFSNEVPSLCGLLEEYVWPSKPKDAGSMPVARSKFLVLSYSGYYTGLSSRISGFDSPQDRQYNATLADVVIAAD